MKLAILSDIHDNMPRLAEATGIIAAEKIKVGICLGDVSRLDTLTEIAKAFDKLYLALGNMDFNLKSQTSQLPENVTWFPESGEFTIGGKKIAIVHNDSLAEDLAKSRKYDLVFYGHTHTPWEKKIGDTIMLNPGEVTGQFGPASFAIFDLDSMKATLKILK